MRFGPLFCIVTQFLVAVFALQLARQEAHPRTHPALYVSFLWVLAAYGGLVTVTLVTGGWPIKDELVRRAWEMLFGYSNVLAIVALWVATRGRDVEHR